MTNTIISTHEEYKKALRREYERGFEDGGADMNKKWLITREEIIGEFLEDLHELWQIGLEITYWKIKKKWEDRLK